MTTSTHIYKNAADYSKNNNLQFEFAMSIIKQFKIHSSARILDLGCGDGLITSKLAEMAESGCVIGTDISQQMINHANETYEKQKNLRFMQMDASKNVFKNQFDIITSFNSLHWIKDQKAVLEGIADAATNNATILLLFSHKKSLYHHILDSVCNSTSWKSYFENYINPRSFCTLNTYKEMLESTGFSTLQITESEMSHQFKNSEDMHKFFSASMSQVTHLPTEKREKFIIDFTRAYLKQAKISRLNDLSISFWCLTVKATIKHKPETKHTPFIAKL